MSETLTWDGVTGDFNTASNWTPSVEPQSGDTAIIDSGTAELASGTNPADGVTLELNGTIAQSGTTFAELLTQGTNVVFGNDFRIVQSELNSAGELATSGTTTFEGTLAVGSSIASSTGTIEFFAIGVDSYDDGSINGDFVNTGLIAVGPGGVLLVSNLEPESPYSPGSGSKEGPDVSPTGGGAVEFNAGTLVLDGGLLATTPSLPIESGVIYLENSGTALISNAVASAYVDFLDGTDTLDVLQAPGFITDYSMQASIVNFQPGDKLVLDLGGDSTAETIGSVSFDSLSQILWVYDPSGNLIDDLNVLGSYAPNAFDFVNTPGTGTVDAFGTISLVSCFTAGTRIGTPGGEAAVEHLRIGDAIVTASGRARPIRWIGRRSYAGRFTRGNRHVLPVLIRAGALADGVPRRDLYVSPNHAMYVDGALIPAIELVNGVSIVQLETVDRVEYFHIELETHDVILADGAPAETFIDDASRGMFHNAAEYLALYPEARAMPAHYCAPRIENGEELEAARQRLAARAGANPASTLDRLPQRRWGR